MKATTPGFGTAAKSSTITHCTRPRRACGKPTGMAGDLQPIKPMKTKNQPIKRCIKNLFLLPALIVVLTLIPTGRVTAQTFTILHNFSIYSDDSDPYAGLVLSRNTLYGTALGGGSSSNGTVFAVNTDGTGFTNLHSFVYSDGIGQFGGLTLSGNTLYGTTVAGGSSGWGTVFAVNTDGTGFTNLHAFTAMSGPYYTNSDGGEPYAGLVLSGNTLYGTALGGGSSGNGTVFAVNIDGTGFTNLHSFVYGDGYNQFGRLTLSGNTLYGTTDSGGSSGNGTVFAVHTDGSGFTNLHSFSATSTNSSGVYINSDGAGPWARLISLGNTLYGTTIGGGSSGHGTVFALNTNGTGFRTLRSLTAGATNSSGVYTNSDGANPQAGLFLSGNTLYGTASKGGSLGGGTVFAVSTDGTGFKTLHDFAYDDGIGPLAGLVLSGNTLYGTTSDFFVDSRYGTVFSLSFRPQLTVTLSGTSVILSWPTNVAGFDYTGYTLQSTTNLISPTIWSTNSPAPVVANGQNTVTSPISGTQKFYRLSQ